MHIRHTMLWEFKNGKNVKENGKIFSSVYSPDVITDCQVQNWFRSGDMSSKD